MVNNGEFSDGSMYFHLSDVTIKVALMYQGVNSCSHMFNDLGKFILKCTTCFAL